MKQLIAISIALLLSPQIAHADVSCGQWSWTGAEYQLTTPLEAELCQMLGDADEGTSECLDNEAPLQDRIDELENALQVRESLITKLLDEKGRAVAQVKHLKASLRARSRK